VRNLKQIITCDYGVGKHHLKISSVLALDVEGELWHGTLETSEDGRQAVKWSPVQLPPDGMSFSKPQLSFWDRMEKEAHDRYQASLDPAGETETVAQEEQTDAGGTRGEVEGASDISLEDGEGID
jgi:hypothetical protein